MEYMKRYVYDYDEETEVETQREIEDFTQEWADVVEGDMENANYHSMLDALSPLIQLLPEIYEKSNKNMKERLTKAVHQWDQYF